MTGIDTEAAVNRTTKSLALCNSTKCTWHLGAAIIEAAHLLLAIIPTGLEGAEPILVVAQSFTNKL